MRIRKNRRQMIVIASLAVGLLGGAEVVSAQVPCGGYEVTAIIQAPECPPFGFSPTIGTAISEPIDGGLPYVVGYIQACFIGPSAAFLWTPEDGIMLIPMPAGTSYSRAVDISGSQIVGEFDNPNELGRTGFVYDLESDEFTSLGTLPGGDSSEAHATNSKGQIVGFWQNGQVGPRHGFIFENGIMQSLGDDLGTPNSQANDINANSQVTGWMGSSPLTDARAFIWDNGDVTELPAIPGGFTSEGWTINDRQDVAGMGRIADPRKGDTVRRAFARIDGEMIVLGTLPGYPDSFGTGINDDRTVVGFAQTNSQRAFVWSDGLMTALNDLVPPELGLNIRVASAINQAGQITGRAISPEATVAFVLTPVEASLGDLDGDCHVGASDLLMLLASWGRCDLCAKCPADLDGDCVVGGADLLTLLVNWG
ncbi:MAG: hypothetical protein V3T53_14780 [Phycisphaerales bacterium]